MPKGVYERRPDMKIFGPRSDEVKRKLSEARKGMKFSDEHRANISRARIGQSAWNTDRTGQYTVKEVVGYRGAHCRCEARFGPIGSQRCVDCGGRAADYSYTGEDSEELYDERGRAYSLSPNFYQPRCRQCHHDFDGVGRAR